MSMSKKDFIRLADYIRDVTRCSEQPFTDSQIGHLADFCREQNSAFKRERWLDYIAGNCGPSGGTIKKSAEERSAP